MSFEYVTKAELHEALAPLATKAELQEVRTELKGDFQALSERMDTQFVELRHHFDVSVEAFRTEVRAIAEICMATNAKVDKLRRAVKKRFRKQDERIDRIDADVYLLKQRAQANGGVSAGAALAPSS